MKRLFAGICIFSILAAPNAAYAVSYGFTRVLTPPIWPDYSFEASIPSENAPPVLSGDGEETDSSENNAVFGDPNILTPIESDYEPPVQSGEMFPIDKMGSIQYEANAVRFTSYVDGYSVSLPNNMQIDMSMSDIGVLFTDEHRTLRIFKESFKTVDERSSYLEYSNKFLENTADHTLESRDSITYGNYQMNILQWSRKSLSKITKDKCHYACVDICVGASVYTFFFTADMPYYMCGDYMDIVKSFIAEKPTVARENAYTKGYKKSDISHMSQNAQQTYNTLFGSNTGFKMGMFAPEVYGGYPVMEGFEKTIGYKFAAILVYTELMEKHSMASYTYALKFNQYLSKVEENLKYAKRTGRAIELTLQTPLSPQGSSNMIYSILNGEYDTFISAYAKMLGRYKDVTVLFRPFNEMNCDWCNYSAYYTSRDPQVYVELYKYLYSKFKSSKNIIWVWNPNEKSFPGYKWNDEQLYYPGDEYVDVYGLTGYNTGTYYESEIWRTFDEIYEPIYSRAERINEKPMMITEFSCSSDGGDKIAWIEDMFSSLYKYPKIKLAIWWHAADYNGSTLARPYFFDTPEGTLDVFKKYLS